VTVAPEQPEVAETPEPAPSAPGRTPLREVVRSPRLLGWGAAWVLAALLPFWISEGQLSTATFVVIGAIGALGLGVLTGLAGQVSLGHAFFLGVGAYTAAVLGGDHHWSAFFWIPAAGLVAAAFGALIGPTALRLRGLYLAIVTIGIVFIGQNIFQNATGITGGPEGRTMPSVHFTNSLDFSYGKQLSVGGLTIDHNGLYYYLGLIILAVSVLFVWNLSRSRYGRAFRAIRERELAASVMGINVAQAKIWAFVISSFLAGISGALYGSFISFAEPTDWSLQLSIQFLAAIIVGGMGTVMGPVLGSIVVFALSDIISSLSFVSQNGSGGISAQDFSSIVYGVLIVGFLVVEPNGLMGLGARFSSRHGPRRGGGNSGANQRTRRVHLRRPRVPLTGGDS
jgi:branched-chain amino acid transport system permease protein